jgi:hypothetical protein
LAKNRCAQARPNFRIPPQNQGKLSGRAFGTPTIWVFQNPFVRLGSIFMTPLELTLSKIAENIHKRSPRAEAPPRKAWCFPKMESTENAKYKCGLGFAKQFSGEKDFAKPRLIFPKRILEFGFRPAERGLGNECGAETVLDFWRGGH